MEKVTLFFCDIRGTFDCGNLSTISDEEVERLVKNLSKLNELNKTNYLVYTFVTTENQDTVEFIENKFKEHASSNIALGNHIYSKDGVEVNKTTDILNYIVNIEKEYEVCENIYYADDSDFYHYMLKEMNNFYENKYVIHSFIPKNHGLIEVNDGIEELIKKSTSKIKVKH